MVKATIRGEEFPLCLTVGALDEINTVCGGLKDLSGYLQGDASIHQTASRVTWMLGLLIREGEAHRRASARFSGEGCEARAVPDGAALAALLTPGAACRYLGVVFEAILESLKQEIEAEPEKNVERAGLK